MVLGKTLESPLDCKEIQPVYPLRKSVLNTDWKDWYWIWSSNTLATWCEELAHWKRPWCWERLKAEEEGDNRGWDGWMAWLTRWTWVWASTGKPGMPQSMGLQCLTRLRDWTELIVDLQCCVSFRYTAKWISYQLLLLLPSIFPSIRVFSNEPVLRIRWPKHWSFRFSISPLVNIQDWFPLGLTGLISLQAKKKNFFLISNTV